MPPKKLTPRKTKQVLSEAIKFVDNKISVRRIEPITSTLQKMFDEYSSNNGIAAIGTAGTGKTYSASYLALMDVLVHKKYKKILYMRSAVQSRDQGFMPGNIKEKEMYYEIPFIEIITDLTGNKEAYNILKQSGTIDFKTTTFIRGLTFSDTIIILDEAQNCNYDELRTVFTRLGENCKIIICGDTKQDDLTKTKNKSDFSGLTKFISILKNVKKFSVINFCREDIIRSEQVKEFIIAEEIFMENAA